MINSKLRIMKFKKITLAISFLFLSLTFSFGQKGVDDGSKYGHGQDSVRCIENYTLYYENYRQKNYTDALPYWRVVYEECPLVRKSIYINGANMYKFFITKAINQKEAKLADSFLDTLCNIYNQRVKWYPADKPRVLGYKAADLMRFKGKDLEYVKKVFDFSNQAIDILGNKSSKANISLYMNSTLILFQKNIISDQEVVDHYAKAVSILNAQIEKNPNDEELDQLKEQIGANFANSGAASCEALVKLFTPQLKESPEDIDVLKKIIFWLGNTDCTDSDLYLHANIALNKVEPSAGLAYRIAQLYNKRGNYQSAVGFYKQAIKGETNMVTKSRYLVELGYITLTQYNDLPQAKKYAVEAINADPASGKPHLLLGTVYASAKDYGEDDLAHKAVYWAAVDQFNMAKKKDSELAKVASDKIKTYAPHFPDTETIFFYGYKVGDQYKIGGWINETTKVRTK